MDYIAIWIMTGDVIITSELGVFQNITVKEKMNVTIPGLFEPSASVSHSRKRGSSNQQRILP